MIDYGEGRHSEYSFEGSRKKSSRSRSRRSKRTSGRSKPRFSSKNRRSRRSPKSLENLFMDMKVRSPHRRTLRRSIGAKSPNFLFEGMGMPPQVGGRRRNSKRSRLSSKKRRSRTNKKRSKRRKSKPFFSPLRFF